MADTGTAGPAAVVTVIAAVFFLLVAVMNYMDNSAKRMATLIIGTPCVVVGLAILLKHMGLS